jgi:glucosamine kinase
MILVADSGSTKCDWILIDDQNERHQTATIGFNPLFHNQANILDELEKNSLLTKFKASVTFIYFYGAGCSSVERNKIIENALNSFFNHSKLIEVNHDLKGAVLAACGDHQGIACILGTGSNACYFDGSEIVQNTKALGYVLGDEGSGSYFGKKLITTWLYKRLPRDLAKSFNAKYNINLEDVLDRVYKQPFANVYLASFAEFLGEQRAHPFVKKMIYEGLTEFVSIHVWSYAMFREVPVNFVGSIAYYFREELEEVARNHRFTVGKIEKQPIEALANYHYQKH